MSDQINEVNEVNEINENKEINKEIIVPEKKARRCRSKKAKVFLTIVIILFAILAIKGIAFARHIHKFADNPHRFIMEMISENLNLNQNQKAQVDRIHDQIKERMESKKPDREAMFEQFANEFKKDNLDVNKLKEFSQKKDQDMESMKDFMMEKMVEFHNILTPEQRNKAVENIKEMKMKFHDKMEHFKDK